MTRYVKWFLAALLLLIIVAGAIRLSGIRRAELADMEKPAPPVYAVHVETAQAGHLAVTREYVGVIEPVAHAGVAFRLEGHLVSAPKDAGDPVDDGEVIAAIDNRPLKRQIEAIEADLAGAESDRSYAKKQLERRRPLLERGLIDPEALDAAESAYETAKSRVEGLRARLASARIDMAYTTIEAPFDGVITARRKQKGDLALPGEPVYTVENPAAGYRVMLRIPRETALVLDPGTPATVRFPPRRIEAAVHRVYPSTQEGHLAIAEIRLAKRPFDLPSGAFVSVDLLHRELSGIRVSVQTLLERDAEARVFRVNVENRIEVVRVTVLGKKGGDAIIAGPVSPGDRLVSAGAAMLLRLSDDAPVRPQPAAAPPSGANPPPSHSSAAANKSRGTSK